MPPIGKIQERVRCPYCSKELARGYIWLHRESYCPMRPSVQEEVKKEAMGTDIHGNDVDDIRVVATNNVRGGPANTITGSNARQGSAGLMSGAIREIDLKEEYKMATTKVNPKKEEDDFECVSCGGKFKDKVKHCPHCGVELE